MYRDDVAIYKIHRDYHAEFTLNIVNVLVMTRKTDGFALQEKAFKRRAGNDITNHNQIVPSAQKLDK